MSGGYCIRNNQLCYVYIVMSSYMYNLALTRQQPTYLKELGGNRELVTATKSNNLLSITETSTHDNGLVA